MLFVCGVVDKTGVRRIFSAESTPTLENIDDLSRSALAATFDWGPEATLEDSEWTARVILSSVTNRDEAVALASAYAEDVVCNLTTDKMWIIPAEEVRGMADEIQASGLKEQLSLSLRPKTLDGLIGQQKLVDAIRGHIQSGRYPKAWLLSGPKGTGKTTTAKILALSYECTHQPVGKFGRPCQLCRRRRSNFPIIEVSSAHFSTMATMSGVLAGAYSGPMGFGKYRIYIINEIQRSSSGCLDKFLDILEETPPSTIFIFTTTEPSRLSEAFRSRCICYEFKDLDTADTEKMVTRLLDKIDSDLPVDRLVEALADNRVGSPRLIAQAVEKYAAGNSPEDAALVSGAPILDIMALSRAITHGDWPEASKYLLALQGADARSLRFLLMDYLRRQLLESSEIGPRADAIAKALTIMASVINAEDAVVFAAICAASYTLTKVFVKYTV